ncbi:nose resistant to fluoxetine protein 6-like isoform X1 [Drosophila eugracilis]|uniref:nose resistant to fluoxetine protein 6-like isoform X1 n=1 Tax=Drosophila eugracilis TaxID=29029 RepID=UPI001BDA4636|nr:nose resistant to fluoxetine protein 6-like isoform X1 [Drosophila eugracilis]
MVNVISVLLLYGLVVISAGTDSNSDGRKEYENLKQLRPLGVEFSEYFQNVSLENFGFSDSKIAGEDDVICLAQLAALMNGLSSSQKWALKMIDSWGSIPSGLYTGNTIDLGNFDECLSISQVIGKQKISGKYCFLITSGLRIATCFPASCSSTQMEPFVKQLLEKILNFNTSSLNMKISDETCQTSEIESWDALTIITIVILSVMNVLVILASIFDYFLWGDQKNIPVVVKAFSARANSRTLFRIVPNKSNPNVIECLHGIRCMSLIWVIFSHEYIFTLTAPNINTAEIWSWAVRPFASFILHGYFSVDSFFVLGGLLVSMIALRSMEKSGGKLNPFLMYLHRLIRIWPVVAMAILIYMRMMPVISGGPMFKSGYHGKEYCEKGWFWTLLFIQNYAVLDICLDHTWYLAVDMQLFIISPILLIALYKWGKKAAAGIAVLVVLLSGCLFVTQMVNNYSLLIKNGGEDDGIPNQRLYLATHNHAAPWLIGFLFGYFLHLNRGKKFQLSRPVVWLGWILSLAMLFTSIFALYPAAQWSAPPLPVLEESLYYTLTRVAWPLAICWVIFVCMQGYGGLANSFLSSPLWQPFSRLSYSMYIWHMFVQEVNSRNVRTNTYFSNYFVMERFWSDLGYTALMSYLLYLLIEAPLSGFESCLRPQRSSAVANQSNLISHKEVEETKDPEDCKETETNPMTVSDPPK